MKNRLPSPFQNVSVATVVIITMVTASTLLLGAFGFISYRSERTRQEAKLAHSLSLDADQFSAALALPIWNFDHAQIDKVIESMMQDQAIYGVVVKLDDVNPHGPDPHPGTATGCRKTPAIQNRPAF